MGNVPLRSSHSLLDLRAKRTRRSSSRSQQAEFIPRLHRRSRGIASINPFKVTDSKDLRNELSRREIKCVGRRYEWTFTGITWMNLKRCSINITPSHDRRNIDLIRRAYRGICSELRYGNRKVHVLGRCSMSHDAEYIVPAPRRFSGLRAIDFHVPYALPFGAPVSIGRPSCSCIRRTRVSQRQHVAPVATLLSLCVSCSGTRGKVSKRATNSIANKETIISSVSRRQDMSC